MSDTIWQNHAQEAKRLDAEDQLSHLRDRYFIPENMIYLAGNSLGPAPKAAFSEVAKAVEQEWANGLVASWNSAGWFAMPETIGDRIGQLIGAAAGQTVLCDTVSLNLFKTLHAAADLRPDRKVIVAEASSFPTDLYVAEGVIKTRSNMELQLERPGGPMLEELINEDTAVVLINHVDYKTGALRDMVALTRKIHAAGAIAIWDLCHSAGVLPVELDTAQADFAVGCTYKYLNAGPGAPGFIYVAERHHTNLSQPLSGWWGHAAPFTFEIGYRSAPGIRAMLTGTQPIISGRIINAALDAIADVSMADLRTKNLKLTDYFIKLVAPICTKYGATITTPIPHHERGGQVSIMFEDGYPVIRALMSRDVVGDFRAPDTMRFGFPPAYIRFTDVLKAAQTLDDVLSNGIWENKEYQQKGAVT